MTRRLLLLAGVLACCSRRRPRAHPLGNFSVNHLAEIGVSADRVERPLRARPRRDRLGPAARAQRRRACCARSRASSSAAWCSTVDGRRVPLEVTDARLSRPPGRAGLPTTRAELSLRAAAADPVRVVLRDGTYPGRVGWRAIVARPGEGTAVRSDVPASDPTDGLRRYPQDRLESPADVRTATPARRARRRARSTRPRHRRAVPARPRRSVAAIRSPTRSRDAVAGRGALLVLLALAFGWGALHALSPGHGKAMVAAYLVGTRGTPRHAVALGGIVTVTHTAGVFALGVVTLALSSVRAARGPAARGSSWPPGCSCSASARRCCGATSGARGGRQPTTHHHDHAHDHAPRHPRPRAPSRRSQPPAAGAHHLARAARDGRGRRAHPVPVGARRPARARSRRARSLLGLGLIVAFSAGLAATLTGARARGRPAPGARSAASPCRARSSSRCPRSPRRPSSARLRAHGAGGAARRLNASDPIRRTLRTCPRDRRAGAASRRRRKAWHDRSARHAAARGRLSSRCAGDAARPRPAHLALAPRRARGAVRRRRPVSAEQIAGGLGGRVPRTRPGLRLPQPRGARARRASSATCTPATAPGATRSPAAATTATRRASAAAPRAARPRGARSRVAAIVAAASATRRGFVHFPIVGRCPAASHSPSPEVHHAHS